MTGRHRDFFPISLGVYALVALFGVLNNEAIATVSPMHFVVYHPRYFPFENAHLQALGFALIVTGAPGLAWGILLYWAGHYGPGPIVGVRATLLGAAVVVILTVSLAWLVGWRETASGIPPYPIFFFPSEDPKLYLSQTVQLTNFIAGFIGASAWLIGIAAWRQHRTKTAAQKT